jgi:hypothetical protein
MSTHKNPYDSDEEIKSEISLSPKPDISEYYDNDEDIKSEFSSSPKPYISESYDEYSEDLDDDEYSEDLDDDEYSEDFDDDEYSEDLDDKKIEIPHSSRPNPNTKEYVDAEIKKSHSSSPIPKSISEITFSHFNNSKDVNKYRKEQTYVYATKINKILKKIIKSQTVYKLHNNLTLFHSELTRILGDKYDRIIINLFKLILETFMFDPIDRMIYEPIKYIDKKNIREILYEIDTTSKYINKNLIYLGKGFKKDYKISNVKSRYLKFSPLLKKIVDTAIKKLLKIEKYQNIDYDIIKIYDLNLLRLRLLKLRLNKKKKYSKNKRRK